MVDALEAEAPPQPSRPSLADTRCDRLRDNDNLRQRRFRRGTFSSSPLATNDLRKCLNYESLSSFPPVLKIDNCNCNADIRACGVDKFACECLGRGDTQPFAVGADVMLTNNLWMEAHSLTAPVTPSSTSSNPRTDATRASSWCTSSSTAGLHCHWTTDCRSDHANLLRPASQDLSPPPPKRPRDVSGHRVQVHSREQQRELLRVRHHHWPLMARRSPRSCSRRRCTGRRTDKSEMTNTTFRFGCA